MANVMTRFQFRSGLCALGLGLSVCLTFSHAMADPLTVYESTTPFGAPSFQPLHLNGAPLGSSGTYSFHDDTVSFAGVESNDGIVKGSSPGVYTAPVIDSAGDTFRGKYFSTGNTGFINIAFAKPQQALSLLWGSIDPSNEITFLSNNQVVATLTGAEIDQEASGAGSLYVLINSALTFNDIEFSSGVPSFELAKLKASSGEIPVHEPTSLALFGSGLLGFVGFRRLRPRRLAER
jgi:hypothetical protein